MFVDTIKATDLE